MVAKVWNQQRYMGNLIMNLSPACWNQIISGPSSVSIATTGYNNYDAYYSKRKV
jgi:hypothetical protein